MNESLPDHPDFFEKLEGMLEAMELNENLNDLVIEQEIADYLQEVRTYYQIKRYNATFAGKLRRVLEWAKR